MNATTNESAAGGAGISGDLTRKILVQLSALLSFVIVCLALWVVYHTLQKIQLSEVLEQIRALPLSSILLAILITAAAYFIVTGYDVLALHHIERPLPYSRVALAGFLACAFGTNLGFAMVTGGAIRYRIYSLAGLSALEIVGVTSMAAITATLGLGFILTLSLLFGTGEAAESTIHVPVELRRIIGWLMLAFMVVYLSVSAFHPVSIRTQNWALKLPSAKIAIGQIVLGTIDLMLLGTLIYVLLPANAGTNFFTFQGVFALAFIAGVLSHVPGGIGVFESVMLLGLPDIPPATLIGAILLFRCIYYLAPLGIAAIVLAVHEATLQRHQLDRVRLLAGDWWAEIGPQVMAVMMVFSGAVLLFSDAVPAPYERLASLRDHLPLPALEISHVLAGAAGLGLILLGRGLSLRLEAAYRLAVTLLGMGIAVLLLKGFNYEGAVVLGVILIVLLNTRPEFLRDGSLFDQGYPTEWMSTLTSILAVTVWLGLFSYKSIEYSQELWWNFEFDAEFPRFLRSTVMVFALFGGLTIVNLLRSAPIPELPDAACLSQVRRVIKQDPNTRASLALLGDKRFLFSDSGKAFIMYRLRGKSWVAFGDPVGPRQEHARLVWAYRELCDRHGGWPVFYLVDAEGLPLYIDLGLSLLKLGDDARVPLETFSLPECERAELRKVHDRVLDQGVSFEIVNSSGVPPLLPELKRVSDDWLAHTQQPERGFSRGSFNSDYIAHFPCAVVRKDNHIVAFAILWVSAHKEELALDLMRYHRDAPEGIMEFMALELMRGGHEQGYRWFNLGMTPLAGLERHALAPLWQRVGRMIYRQSEHFHDSESYRRFAEVLGPVWRPKYLASPGGLKTPRILRDIANLIARTQA